MRIWWWWTRIRDTNGRHVHEIPVTDTVMHDVAAQYRDFDKAEYEWWRGGKFDPTFGKFSTIMAMRKGGTQSDDEKGTLILLVVGTRDSGYVLPHLLDEVE